MTAPRYPVTLVLAAALAIAGVPGAASPPAGASVRAPDPGVPLPGSGSVRAAVTAGGWIVGGRPRAVTPAIARRFGARALRLPGTYVVPVTRARAFAAMLRRSGALRFAEPNAPRRALSSFDAQQDQWARGAIVAPTLPSPSPSVPIGVIDDFVDSSHPDLAGRVTYLNLTPGSAIAGPHGTMVASAAAGAANGSGVTGIFPAAPIVSYGVPAEFGCAESADGILALAAERVPIINASYGSANACYAEYAAISMAYASGTMVVAAAGNEFQEGNPVIYPAAWPHVLSVAATNVSRRSAYFSTANAAIDVAAPGEDVPVAVPTAMDTDGVADGWTVTSGTSFAAPMVAGAAAWLKAARPELQNGQAAELLRRTADDVAAPGWDRDTGYGQINLQRALGAAVPRVDPLEPNDTIAEVDGRVFGKPDASVWRGNGRVRVSASVDSVEDPADVYRLRVPGKARFKVLLRPNTGDPDLAAYSGRATALSDTDEELDRSRRGEGRTDVVRVINNSGEARTAYVVVYVPDEAKYADAGYRLDFVRERRR
jgi:hypothetical protein